MPAGLQIINDFGTILIDDTSPCLQLKSSATYTFPMNHTGMYEFTVNNVDQPFIALRCESTFIGIVKYVRSGTTLQLGVRVSDTTVNRVFTVYHFDMPAAPTGTFGLQVYNSLGQCMFDSNGKTAVVLAKDQPNGIWTGDPGRSYAFGFHTMYQQYIYTRDGPKYDYVFNINAAKCYNNVVDVSNNKTIEVGQAIIGPIGPYGSVSYSTGIQGGLIIDVTGY